MTVAELKRSSIWKNLKKMYPYRVVITHQNSIGELVSVASANDLNLVLELCVHSSKSIISLTTCTPGDGLLAAIRGKEIGLAEWQKAAMNPLCTGISSDVFRKHVYRIDEYNFDQRDKWELAYFPIPDDIKNRVVLRCIAIDDDWVVIYSST